MARENKSVKAFLFDLDGTLIDSELLWARILACYIQDHGGQADVAHILAIVYGHSWVDIQGILHAEYPCLPKATPEEDAAALRPYYTRMVGDPATLVITSSVQFFREAAKVAPCAIVSGSPRESILEAARVCGIKDLLALAMGPESYAMGKPAPDGYLAAAKCLHVKPEECVVVEDSEAGVQSGVAAGMRVVALKHESGVPQDLSGATWCVNSLADVDFKWFGA